MNGRWDAAPEPEWVLMYRRGLSRGKIADLTGAPLRTVSYHLAVARKLHHGLQSEHEVAAGWTRKRVTGQGRERMAQLIAMVQARGRYPSTKAEDKTERALAAWMNRRRQEAIKGTLLPVFRDGLSILPGWQDISRVGTDEVRWQERLDALEAYRGSGQDWPRHKATIEGLEHELGVWLHIQRYKLRRGELAPAKLAALDATVPGWQSGRTRGRKPRGSSTADPTPPRA